MDNLLKVSNNCNNNCLICNYFCRKAGEEKSINQIKKELDDLKKSGMEELRLPCNADKRKDIIGIVSHAKRLGFNKIVLETNGRIFSYRDFTKKMVRSGLDEFAVFLHGYDAKAHNKITRVKDSFEQTIEGIKNLVEFGKNVTVDVVITRDNYEDLNKIVEQVGNLGVKNISFIFLNNSPELHKIVPFIKQSIKTAEKYGVKLKVNNYHYLLGAVTGYPFIGPKIVHIEIINKCDHKCIYCWFHSPKLKEKKPKWWQEQTLDLKVFKKVVDELAGVKTKIILLSGLGEPFLHPDIMEMTRYVKEKGIRLEFVTNGTFLLSKKISKELVDLGVDSAAINISAATAETYIKIHTNQPKKTFNKIKENLIYIKRLKESRGLNKPVIKVVDIVTSTNYDEIEKIIEFTKEVGGSEIRFKPFDPVGGTEHLLLSNQQIEDLKRKEKELLAKMDELNIKNNLHYYIQLITASGAKTGFYTKDRWVSVGCYTPWNFLRVLADNVSCSPCYHSPIILPIGDFDFDEIWNSQKYKDFRDYLNEMNKDKSKAVYESCKQCVNFINTLENLEFHEELKKHNLLQFLK